MKTRQSGMSLVELMVGMMVGLIGIVEMVYRLSEQGASTILNVFGMAFDARTTAPWIGFALVLAAGIVALRLASRLVGARWGTIQQDLLARQP